MSILLEPIKTALTAGDAAGARRERLELFRVILDDLLDEDSDHCQDLNYIEYYQGWRGVVEMVDALGIPEEP
jgi:hypothetical protein